MTEEKKRVLQERMAALHEKYCNQLPDKYLEIQDSWQQYQTDFNNPIYIEEFYRLIHTLKGTAATFGFAKQADICFDIQKALLETKKGQSALSESALNTIQQHLSALKANISTPAKAQD